MCTKDILGRGVGGCQGFCLKSSHKREKVWRPPWRDKKNTFLVVCLWKNLFQTNFLTNKTVCACVFSESCFAKGICLEIYENCQHGANKGPSWVKRKKKSSAVSGSQILCKMSWDGDHLDKDIPTPPNKMQVRKQEKHTPTHRAEPRHRMIEGRQLCTMQEEVGLHGHLGIQSLWESWECPSQHPRRRWAQILLNVKL